MSAYAVSITEKHLANSGEEDEELLRLHAEFCNRLTATQPLAEHVLNIFTLAPGNGHEYSMVSEVRSMDFKALNDISNAISTRTLERNSQSKGTDWQKVFENPAYTVHVMSSKSPRTSN